MADPKYDTQTTDLLMGNDFPYAESSTRVRNVSGGNLPSTAAGIPNLVLRDMPYLTGTNARGFVLDSNRKADMGVNQTMQQNIFLRPDANNETIAHETEHLLARQNTGTSTAPRDKFNQLLGDSQTAMNGRISFLSGLKESLPYLKDKYGISNGYMDKNFIDKQGSVGLYEIFATLAGAEAAHNVDLTKDPELRKTLFKDRNVREAYNAVTGLRQTRLDAKDLPPYTRLAEPSEPGITDKLKKLLGFANGGFIDKPLAGGHKII